MLKTEIDEIEKLSNTDPHNDMHSDMCEMFEGDDCDCQNYHCQFLNLQKETLKLVAYVRKLEKMREKSKTLIYWCNKNGYSGVIFDEANEALKECAGDDRHCLHCGKNLGSDLPNVKWCNTDCMDAGESERRGRVSE